jgi:ankyrin repeat protein
LVIIRNSSTNQPTTMESEQEQFDYSDIEQEDGDAMEDEDEVDADMTELDKYIQSYDWSAVLRRIKSHPYECRNVNRTEGRLPLHVACDHDAPAVVIQTLLQVYPEASIRTGTSNMNPLHITCSSPQASVHIVRVLIEMGLSEQFSMRDVDGDTPLHAACRCGASLEVLELLCQAHSAAVHVLDYEGLTPLLRLWVRNFVIWKEEELLNLPAWEGDLWDAWHKTELLLRAAHCACSPECAKTSASAASSAYPNLQAVLARVNSFTSLLQSTEASASSSSSSSVPRRCRTLHAAAAVDAPRAVLHICLRMYPEQLRERDEQGRTPLLVAAAAPMYPPHNLSDDGYSLQEQEDQVDVPPASSSILAEEITQIPGTTSVLEVLLAADPEGAQQVDPSGRLPLHIALESGKRWCDGVSALVQAYPESVAIADRSTKLYPYQLAATKENVYNTYALLRLNPTLLQLQHPRNIPTSGAAILPGLQKKKEASMP